MRNNGRLLLFYKFKKTSKTWRLKNLSMSIPFKVISKLIYNECSHSKVIGVYHKWEIMPRLPWKLPLKTQSRFEILVSTKQITSCKGTSASSLITAVCRKHIKSIVFYWTVELREISKHCGFLYLPTCSMMSSLFCHPLHFFEIYSNLIVHFPFAKSIRFNFWCVILSDLCYSPAS